MVRNTDGPICLSVMNARHWPTAVINAPIPSMLVRPER